MASNVTSVAISGDNDFICAIKQEALYCWGFEPTCKCGWSGGDQPTEYDAELVGERHLAQMFPRPALIESLASTPASSEPLPLHTVLPAVTDKPIAPEPLTANELSELHYALDIALNEGMACDEDGGYRLLTKLAALEAYLRSVTP